jgi:hypothetical protein
MIGRFSFYGDEKAIHESNHQTTESNK